MWSFIQLAIYEIAIRPKAVFKVFWPLVIYVAVAVCVAVAGIALFSLLPDHGQPGRATLGLLIIGLLAAFAILAALAIAPVAVNWHRVVILGEAPTWRLPNFRKNLLPYGIRLGGFIFGSFVLVIALKLVWNLTIWVFLAGEGDHFLSPVPWFTFLLSKPTSFSVWLFRVSPTIGQLLVNAVYLFLFGRWMLSLPASAVGALQSATRPIPYRAVLAIFVVYSVPICLGGLAEHYATTQKYSYGNEPIWQDIAVGIVGLMALLLSLTILSVAYRESSETEKQPKTFTDE